MANVFVYGTLREGGRLHGHLGPKPKLVSRGWVEGKMFDAGGFPAGIFMRENLPGNWSKVNGEVYDITPTIQKRLDWIEGYHADDVHGSLYIPRSILVRIDERGRDVVRTLVYEWNRSVEGFPQITDYDYLEYLAAKEGKDGSVANLS